MSRSYGRYGGVVVCNEHVELLKEAVACHYATMAAARAAAHQAAVLKRWRQMIQKVVLKRSMIEKHWKDST
eukprot:m.55283 g.55283  ORF g.55283 m.55283 type:complete len:71 (-) comp7589_c0_seq2:24-236(-)